MAKESILSKLSADYFIAVQTIKDAILRSQYQAAKLVNREMLSLYFGIGRYISANSRDGFWGTGAIKTISEHLRKELPGLRGFSETNLRNMRQFYEEWSPVLSRLSFSEFYTPYGNSCRGKRYRQPDEIYSSFSRKSLGCKEATGRNQSQCG